MPTLEAIEARVTMEPMSGCWLWLGELTPKGYARWEVGGKRYRVNRLVLELVRGPLGDLLACHRCDNRICVNPAHLYAGTNTDNMRDWVARGVKRPKHPRGPGRKGAPPPHVDLVCIACGADFSGAPRRKYCGQVCDRRERSKAMAALWKSGRLTGEMSAAARRKSLPVSSHREQLRDLDILLSRAFGWRAPEGRQ